MRGCHGRVWVREGQMRDVPGGGVLVWLFGAILVALMAASFVLGRVSAS